MKTLSIVQTLTLTLATFLIFSTSLTAQNWSWYGGKGIKGEGPVVTKSFDLPTIHSVCLGFSGDVYIKQGRSQSISIEAQQNIMDNITMDVRGGKWKINFDENVKQCENVKVYITMTDLEELCLTGSGMIKGENHFANLDDVELGVSGSGDIILSMDSDRVDLGISGSGGIDLSGTANALDVGVSGSGDVEAFDFITADCEVSISGSGDIEVNATQSLVVSVSGSGDVEYKGNPASVKSSSSGSGDINSRN